MDADDGGVEGEEQGMARKTDAAASPLRGAICCWFDWGLRREINSRILENSIVERLAGLGDLDLDVGEEGGAPQPRGINVIHV